MNEYNHHRIIKRFVFDNQGKNLPQNIEDVFVKASNFTDSINAELKYYFYHFYYDIEVGEDNTIELLRVDEKNNLSAQSMKHCGNYINQVECEMPFSPQKDEKEFFSFINDRPRSPRHKLFDMGNQSDNVAFLHAMGAELEYGLSEKPRLSQVIFEEHLKKCFAEYLFLEDESKALFMLGIAMHGIMDSFTPSHMGFQHYTKQDMALHAQGDVIPIRNISVVESEKHELKAAEQTKIEYQHSQEEVDFVPGQYDREKSRGARLLADIKKNYNNDDYLNDIEYEMLKIYLYISRLKNSRTSEVIEGYDAVTKKWKSFKGLKLSQINNELSQYEYDETAYIFSDTAVKAMTEVMDVLAKVRKQCEEEQQKYQFYKENKEATIEKAVTCWRKLYNSINGQREEHTKWNLYAKELGDYLRLLMKQKGEQKYMDYSMSKWHRDL